jgi:hypothetical protein
MSTMAKRARSCETPRSSTSITRSIRGPSMRPISGIATT